MDSESFGIGGRAAGNGLDAIAAGLQALGNNVGSAVNEREVFGSGVGASRAEDDGVVDIEGG